MTTKQAWFCPACQRHHAPHCDTCPKPVDLIGKEFMPTAPQPIFTPHAAEICVVLALVIALICWAVS